MFKKKGLLRSQQGLVAGEGVAYLKSVRTNTLESLHHSLSSVQPLWWIGMTSRSMGVALSVLGPCVDRGLVMILGELCNFAGTSDSSARLLCTIFIVP